MVVVFFVHLLRKNCSRQQTFSCPEVLTLHTCAVDSFLRQHFWNGGDFCSLFSMYRTKFDAK